MINLSSILKETKDGIMINARLVPNSSVNKIADCTLEYIRIKIAAPAVENKANQELAEFLSKILGIKKSLITIASGQKSKMKCILIKNARMIDIKEKLLKACPFDA